jgi:hypothetical protein
VIRESTVNVLRTSALTATAAVLSVALVSNLPEALAPQDRYHQVAYNGGFTFTRIRYGGGGFRGRGGSSWSHDYPQADYNISQIVEYVSTIPINVAGTNVFDLDDPEIFRHPIIYISEPGFWRMTDDEGESLRHYLLKGGFLILDDFEAEQWHNMEENLRRALPELQLIEVGPEHPIFSSFFRMSDIYVPHPSVRVTPQYFALFENNDPKGRMLALVNYNSDLAEYWEFSANTGYFPVDLTNESYKLGVNYIYYALVH